MPSRLGRNNLSFLWDVTVTWVSNLVIFFHPFQTFYAYQVKVYRLNSTHSRVHLWATVTNGLDFSTGKLDFMTPNSIIMKTVHRYKNISVVSQLWIHYTLYMKNSQEFMTTVRQFFYGWPSVRVSHLSK